MSSVYIVYGDSDEIEGVFSTQEMADEAARRIGGDVGSARFDEMPDLPDGLYGWHLEFVGDELRTIYRTNAWTAMARGNECYEPTNVLDRKPRTRYVRCRAADRGSAIAIAKAMAGASGPDEPIVIPPGYAVVAITTEDILRDGMSDLAFWKKRAEAGGQ